MYLEASQKPANIHQHDGVDLSAQSASRLKLPTIILAVLILLIGSSREIYQSLYRFPYEYGSLCFISKDLSKDGWSSGVYEFEIPNDANIIVIPLEVNRPDIDAHHMDIEAQIINSRDEIIFSKTYKVTERSDLKVMLDVPGIKLNESRFLRARIKLSSCFTPRNMGLNFDGRRLGVQILDHEFVPRRSQL